MSIIKLKVRISEKISKDILTDKELSDATGGIVYFGCDGHAQIAVSPKVQNLPKAMTFLGYNRPENALKKPPAANSGDRRGTRLGRLIGYCADCKCPVYSVTRKNHAGHNVITGAGR